MKVQAKDSDMFYKRALMAANWFAVSQLGSSPYQDSWNTERGRFMYQYYIPGKQYVPGINWTMGRGLFTLSDVLNQASDTNLSEAAYRAYRYISALQIMDPYYPGAVGAIKEVAPQGSFCGSLDGAQAASGLLMYGQVSGNKDAVRRGRAFCDYLLRYFDEKKGMPAAIELYPEFKVTHDFGYGQNAIGQSTAIPCWHMYKMSGEEKYLKPVVWGADFILACQRSDGAMHNEKDITSAEPSVPNHHNGRGEGDERYVLHNDDSMTVIVLAAYLATKEQKYLDSLVAYANWIVNQDVQERPYCAFPVRANTVLDIARVSGKDYSSWVLDNLQKHLLDLQVLDSGDPRADGGFRGEDEQNEGGVFGGGSLDYITTRMTCYAAGTLMRLSGKGTGSGFSPFGLARDE
jgi:hypothetical protein